MAGRPKMKMYEYDTNGKFVCEYPTQMDVFNKYYGGKKRPLVRPHEQYAVLPNGHYIAEYRIGRDKLLDMIKLENSRFVPKRNEKRKSVSVYNLLGEKIATFRSVHIAALMLGVSSSRLREQIGTKYNQKQSKTWDLIFKYEE